MTRRHRSSLRPRLESLEERLCLASSVGWDGPGRGAASLKFYIGDAPSTLDQATTNAAIKRALNAWSAVANIRFTQTTVPNQARSLDLTFKPIDGPGGVLAQGYYPADVNPARIAGDVQFDATERWEVGNAQGSAAVDLVEVAVHEIGHALGLDHSGASGSVMAASVSANESFSGLAATDVRAIRSIYAPAGSANVRAASAASVRRASSARIMVATPDESPATTPPARPTPKFLAPRLWRARPAAIAFA